MLGGFSEEALQLFQLAASEQSYEFSEGDEVYDFTRCMRPDGSFYGTSGTCKKGSAAGAKEKEAPKTAGGRKRRATAEGKAADAAARKAAGGAKRSATAGRARLLKEELDKVKDKMRGADSETQNRLLKEASAAADSRSKAGETAPKASRKKIAAAKARQEGRDVELDKQVVGGQKAAAKAKAKLDAEPKKPQAGRPSPEELNRRVAAQEKADKEFMAKKPRKPRATTAETKPAWQEAERAVVDAKKKFQDAARETKGDQSVEARQRRLEAGRELDKAERAAYKASSRYEAARKRESYAKMTPEQKKEERDWRKNLKKYG
jgi:hypothetical protein